MLPSEIDLITEASENLTEALKRGDIERAEELYIELKETWSNICE